jgi:hypothetical protein
VAPLPAPAVPPEFLPQTATTAAPPAVTNDGHHLVRGRPYRLPKSDGRWESELLGHVVSPELPCAGRWVLEPRRHVAPSELPCAGRWEPESRGHLAPLELPYVRRRVLEPRRHVAPSELPCAGRRVLEPRRHVAAPEPRGGYHSTAPSSTPFRGRSGCGGACHAPR